MKNIITEIGRMLHESDPRICFSIEFWDGDTVRFGESPQVSVRLNSEEGARRIVELGFVALFESVTTGDLEIDGHMPDVFQVGLSGMGLN